MMRRPVSSKCGVSTRVPPPTRTTGMFPTATRPPRPVPRSPSTPSRRAPSPRDPLPATPLSARIGSPGGRWQPCPVGSLRSPAPTRRARHLARVSGSTAHTLNAGGESSDVTVQTCNTAPELRLRRILCSRGLRYRVHRRPLSDLARQADIAFTGAKVAVFVDGCVWHGCPEHGRR